MTVFEYISKNIDRIKWEVHNGIFPCSLINQWMIYSRYDYYMRTKLPKTKAILFTSLDFNVTEYWIYCVIKRMEAEYENTVLSRSADKA
jgi:hypothetical protein